MTIIGHISAFSEGKVEPQHWLVEALTGMNGLDILTIAAMACITAWALCHVRKIVREG